MKAGSRASGRSLALLAAAASLLSAVGMAGTARASTPGPAARFEGVPAAAADTDSVARDTVERRTPARDTLEAQEDTADVTDSAAVEAMRRDMASGDFPSRDSLFERLLDLAGFHTVEFRGRRVGMDVEREVVELHGDAQANYASSVLQADSIAYMAGAQFISARRGIRLAGADRREVTSDSVLYYDVSGLKGTIMDARTRFAERGAEWYVRGTATPRGDRTVFVERGSFTSCELEEPHYYFRAGKIKVVSENILVAWPIVLYIQGVPVAWLPFFAQDIRPGRRSGFLPPRFGVNDVVRTSGNLQRQISDFGYYFALSPFMDAQVTVDWFSGNFTRLNGAYRYRFLKSFIQGNVLTSYSLGDQGRSLELSLRHDQDLSPVTNLRVNARFVQNTRLFEEQSFDPRQQTQDISSDFGFNHRFSFANLSLSGRRRQFLGAQSGRTELTLPQLNMTFSPVTLFRAPAVRAGLFNNITLNGGFSFSRQDISQETRDDQVTTRGQVSNGVRLGNLSFSNTASLNAVETVPFDSLGPAPPAFTRTTVTYGSSTSYQVNLMGSTVLRPTLSVDGSAFRSPDTGDEFVGAPTRLNLGASLSTDVYGFLPGFGPFSRIRHKISPRFNYTYAPEVAVADSLLEIPGFPGSAARERNMLTLTLNQTFEAKVRPETPPADEGPPPPEEPPVAGGDAVAVEEAGEPPGEAEPEAPPGEAPSPEGEAVDAPEGTEEVTPAVPGARGRAAPRQQPQERKVVLLAVNTSALQFDFTSGRGGGPALITDRLQNALSSDLLRGFSFNMTHDLFEGSGEDRTFRPFLTKLSGSFSFRSSAGLSGLFGLRPAGRAAPRASADPDRRFRQEVDSRYRLQEFERPDEEVESPEARAAGPWTLNLNYTLNRNRPDEDVGGVRETQSLGAVLALQPTPNWRLRWRTQYNVSDGEFGEHLVTLDRDLHRWEASFLFARSPNGNFLFQVRVNLRDAPELKVDYDQRTTTSR